MSKSASLIVFALFVVCALGCPSTQYTVQSGDTCSAIASAQQITLSVLYSLNPSVNSGCTNLAIGQVLVVCPPSTSPTTARPAATTPAPTAATTSASSGAWPNGPIKAIYVDTIPSGTTIDTNVKAAADAGYNLIILAFYVSSVPYDAVYKWSNLTLSVRTSVMDYVHGKGAKVLVSAGGSTDTPYAGNGTTYGQNVATFANTYNLDGVDFDLENFGFGFVANGMTTQQTINWVANATNQARKTLGTSKIITHAPQSPYFGNGGNFAGSLKGYVQVYKQATSINYLLIQYYNQGSGCFTTQAGIFTSSASDCSAYSVGNSINEIVSYGIPMNKLVVGKYVNTNDGGNGYVAPATLKTWLQNVKTSIGYNTGVMGWQWHDSATNKAWISAIYPL